MINFIKATKLTVNLGFDCLPVGFGGIGSSIGLIIVNFLIKQM